MFYRVVDNDFNRAWYKDIIGNVYPTGYVPSYAIVKTVNCETCEGTFGPDNALPATEEINSVLISSRKRYVCVNHANGWT